jgi:membrane associated rhomboid family serine protease
MANSTRRDLRNTTLRQLQGRLGRYNFWVLAAIVAAHVVALLAVRLLPGALRVYTDAVGLSLANLSGGRIWTLLTYALAHDLQTLSHLLLNGLGLVFFGAPFEKAHGSRRYLQLAGLATVVGGLAQMLWQLATGDSSMVVGASAFTMALLGAFAWQNPHAEVLLFFAIRLPARWLVPLAVGMDLLGALAGSDVAVFAHLGGLAAAWFLVVAGANPRQVIARVQLAVRRFKGQPPPSRTLRVIPGGKSPSGKDKPPSRDQWN